MCLSGTLLLASVPGGAWQRGAGGPPAAARPLPTGCYRHPSLNASQAVGNGVSWVFVTTLPLTACFVSLQQQKLQLPGAGRRCGTAEDTVAFGRVSGLCCLSSHAHSAFLFHFKLTIFGRRAGLLPRTEPRMYWIRPTGRLVWESSSTSSQAGVLPKNALRLPGVVQRYPMESAGKTVT